MKAITDRHYIKIYLARTHNLCVCDVGLFRRLVVRVCDVCGIWPTLPFDMLHMLLPFPLRPTQHNSAQLTSSNPPPMRAALEEKKGVYLKNIFKI